MFSLNDSNRFFLYPFPTDMRKSFDTLCGIVTNQMGRNILEGDAYIFINRFCTNMKILHVECGGLVIYNLRLEKGYIELPQIDQEDRITAIETQWSHLIMMVNGMRMETCRKQNRWSPSETIQAQKK